MRVAGSRAIALLVFMWLISASLFGSTSARAFIDDSTIADTFGSVRFTMHRCSDNEHAVQVDADHYTPSGISQAAAAELLRRAIVYSWQNCVWRNGIDQHWVSSAYITIRGTIYAFRADNLQHNSDGVYYWGEFGDTIGNQPIAGSEQSGDERPGVFWSELKTLFWLGVFIVVAIWIFRHWETFARWYYLLTPHPATEMVRAAANAGVALDGEAFSEILRPIPGSRVAQEVRKQQASKLAEIARKSTAELERKAAELRQKLREQAAYQAAQRDLHDSAIEQQLAAMRAEALEKVNAFVNRGKTHERE